MKKLKKILAILSAAVLTSSMAIYPVSAEGIAEEIFIQDRGVIYNGHKNHPAKRTVETTYMGILLTMPDGEAPTAEELGLDECEITDYTFAEEVFCGLYGTTDGEGLLTNGSLVTMTEGNENSYLVSSESLTEESAIELVKKLKIRGVVSNADICYETCVDVADFYVTHKETSFTVECHDLEEYVSNNHEPTAEDHNLYGFEELAESGLSIKSLYVTKPQLFDYYYIDYTLEFDHDKYTENIAQLYDELQVVSKKINERYAADENYISSGTDWIQYVFDDEPMNGLLSVEPTWGDATNDDTIDIYDAVEIAKHVMNLNELDEDTVLLADINRDGETNLYDAIEISKTLMS